MYFIIFNFFVQYLKLNFANISPVSGRNTLCYTPKFNDTGSLRPAVGCLQTVTYYGTSVGVILASNRNRISEAINSSKTVCKTKLYAHEQIFYEYTFFEV